MILPKPVSLVIVKALDKYVTKLLTDFLNLESKEVHDIQLNMNVCSAPKAMRINNSSKPDIS